MICDVGVRLHSPSVGLSPESSASSTSDNSILGLRPDVVLLAIPALPVILRQVPDLYVVPLVLDG